MDEYTEDLQYDTLPVPGDVYNEDEVSYSE